MATSRNPSAFVLTAPTSLPASTGARAEKNAPGRVAAQKAGASDPWLTKATRHLQQAARGSSAEAEAEAVTLTSAGVTARFTAAGVEVGSWLYTFQESAGAVTVPQRKGPRVVYQRAGGITEWYEANEAGIEQGFTVAQKPSGPAADLVVTGKITVPHAAQVGEGEVAFGSLRYSHLKAWDATGRELVSAMEWDGASRTLALRIRASTLIGAVFPVTIDPLLSTSSWTADPTDQASANFGGSVSSAGDVNGDGFADVLVGADGWDGTGVNEGRVYLYLGSANGLAATPAWTADPTDQADANFGASVSGVGDVNGDGFADVLVGAYGWDGVALDEGRAYLYLGSASGLAATPAWTADPTDQAYATFGTSVSGVGDVNGDGFADVVVGAFRWDGMGVDEGRAFLYLGSATGLAALPVWTADPTDQAGASFGGFVSAAGDVNGDGFADVLVGAQSWDGAAADEGRAYLYLGSSTGLGATPAWTADPTDQAGANFGGAVAGAGDVNGDGFADVLVGASSWDGTGANEGRAYLYAGSASGLGATPAWSPDPTNQVGANFGGAVAGAGDVNGDGFADVLVSAHEWDGAAATDEGAAFLYLGSSTGLAVTPVWTADPTNQTAADFGTSVSSAGDVNGDGFTDVVVGARFWDGAAANEGRAFIYLGSANGLSALSWTADPTDQAGAGFGSPVTGAGDVNGDGYADLMVGACGWDGLAADEGRAHLYLGSATGLGAMPAWTADPTDQAGALFGFSISGVGDVNGDGFADVLVGAPYWDGAAADEGRVYLYLGSATGLAVSASWTANPTNQASALFGYSVSGAGDVNGDGFADVLVGAFRWDGAVSDEGRAYLYLGSATGLAATPAWTADPTDQLSAGFGNSVSGAGDVNGDGYADVVVGASYWDGIAPDEGRAYLYFGSATGLSATPAWTAAPTNQFNAVFGNSVSGAGDVNGDGFDDVLVAAFKWDGAASDEGRGYLYLGSATGLAATPAWTANPTSQGNASFGNSISGAGDVNGDGFADVLVGASTWDGMGFSFDQGRAYLYLGGAAGLAVIPGWTAAPTDQGFDYFGISVSGAGDVNGDGFADVVAGASGWDGAATNEGRAYLYPGGDGDRPGLDRRLRQLQSNGTTPIGLGNSAGGNGVVLEQRVTQEGPVGARLQLEVEVKRVGVPFDGLGAVLSASVLAGQTAKATVSGLGMGAYRWRSRVVYPVKTGRGRWVSHGRNSEGGVDFRVLVAPNGTGCAVATQCVSANCVDGVCCNTACDGACDVCNALGTCTPTAAGFAGAPSCAPYLCSGTSASCPISCTLDSQCAAGQYCDGSCVPKKLAGVLCGAANQCAGNNCVDTVCCNTACAGSCDSCNLAGAEGICSSVPAGTAGSPTCAPYLCSGSAVSCPTGCVDGGACASGNVCAGNVCVVNPDDGGMGGADGGDRLPRSFLVGCGCGSVPSGGLFWALLLVGLARRRAIVPS